MEFAETKFEPDSNIENEWENVKPIFELIEKTDITCSENDIKSELDKKDIKIKKCEDNREDSNDNFKKYEDLGTQFKSNTEKVNKPSKQENVSWLSNSETNYYGRVVKNMKKAKRYKNKIYFCAHCNYNSSNRNVFVGHIAMHCEPDKYKCEHCSFTSSKKSTLNKHSQTHNNTRALYRCATCKQDFKTKWSLVKHLQTKTDVRPFKCAYCKRDFTKKYILQNHLRTHTGERTFKCLVCDYRCARKCSLDIHKRRMHSDNDKYKCESRNQRGEMLQDIDSKIHPFKCSLCNYSCQHKSRMKYHTQRHSGERHFQCDHCGLSYYRKTELLYHIMKHMKPHQCSTCKYSSMKISDLQKHEQTQHGLARYNCADCKFTCNWRKKMEKHVETHM